MLTPQNDFSDTKQLTYIHTIIYIHFFTAFARSRKAERVKFRLGLNKAAAVTSHHILIRHNLVLGGRGKPLFFCYFHL